MKEEKKESLFKKYKTDKKYKAKIQLIGYGLFILLVIIYVNISSMNSSTGSNITTIKNNINQTETEKNTEEEKKSNLLNKINNNYEFETKITITTKKEEQEEKKELSYSGKRSKNNTEINKKTMDNTNTFYKVDSRYYTKINDTYQIIKSEEIYDTLEKEYIEWEYIKEYIEKSSLDHITEYSSGKKEYVYHLKVKDIIKSHPEIDEIEINITEENDILTIEFNYTNLIKALSKEIDECKMQTTYKNIGKVEDFIVIEETNTDNQGETNE